jgi:hypothetical protein
LAVENVKKNFLTPTQADTMISVVAWNTEAVKGEVKPGLRQPEEVSGIRRFESRATSPYQNGAQRNSMSLCRESRIHCGLRFMLPSRLQNSIFECDQASGHDFSRAERGAKGNLGFSPCNLVFSYSQFRSG